MWNLQNIFSTHLQNAVGLSLGYPMNISSVIRYGDGAGNIVKENSSVSSLIQMR